MAAVLLLDLDNTLADREAAFLTWARSKAKQWAPNQPDALEFLVEQDADGMCPRADFFALLAERFGLSEPV
ncbi:MAG: HAD family hydrolase, partial [Actinobacteria bacterium]|nr:HAD family hydrolase [Actinomycetota bacterium]